MTLGRGIPEESEPSPIVSTPASTPVAIKKAISPGAGVTVSVASARRELVRFMAFDLARDRIGDLPPAEQDERLELSMREQSDLTAHGVAAILGRSVFIDQVVRRSESRASRRNRLSSLGLDVPRMIDASCEAFGADRSAVHAGRRTSAETKARAVAAHFLCEVLRQSQSEAARQLGVSPSAIAEAATRGRQLAQDRGLEPEQFLR